MAVLIRMKPRNEIGGLEDFTLVEDPRVVPGFPVDTAGVSVKICLKELNTFEYILWLSRLHWLKVEEGLLLV